jgi:hypothetical protein
MTGNCPDTDTLWNLTNLEEFLTNNHSKFVYREKTQIRFTYDGNKQKRILQRMPIDSIEIFAQHGVIPQDYASNIVVSDGSAEYQEAFEQYQTEMNPDSTIPEAKRIISDNNIYALIKIPHKESSANTTGNDLIMLISNVGSLPDDFVSISDTNFIQGKKFNLRNATVSIFQLFKYP